jgi:hypothetical protein
MPTAEEAIGSIYMIVATGELENGEEVAPVPFTVELNDEINVLLLWGSEDGAKDFMQSPGWGRARIVKEISSSETLLAILEAAYEHGGVEWVLVDAPLPEEWPEEGWEFTPPTVFSPVELVIEGLKEGEIQF